MFLQTPMMLDVEIRGPAEVKVGDAAGFTAVATGGKPAYSFSWSVRSPDGGSTPIGTDASDLEYEFSEPGVYTITAFVRDENSTSVGAEFPVEVTGSMSVVISVSGAEGVVIVGRRVMLMADISGAVEGAVLRYVCGLPMETWTGRRKRSH